MLRFVVSTSIVAAGLATPMVAGAAPDGRGGYIVERGDSLYGIAREQGVPIGDLLRANDLRLSSVIHPGQRLRLPGAAGPPAASVPPSTTSYTVRGGDSLWGISRRLDVPLPSLLGANGLTMASVIHPGRVLVVPSGSAAQAPATPGPAAPGPAPSSGAPGSYTVRAGDSLWGISRRLGVAFSALLGANGLTATSLILPGRSLIVPAGSAPAPPTTPPGSATPAPGSISTAEAERIIRDVWPDDLDQQAVDIARRESGLRPTAQNACCVGLFQLYYDVHAGWLAGMGITSRGALLDARANARAALALYQQAGWKPWAVSPTG